MRFFAKVDNFESILKLEILASEKDYEKELMNMTTNLDIDSKRRVSSHYDTMISEID